jgi:hypothetical protein
MGNFYDRVRAQDCVFATTNGLEMPSWVKGDTYPVCETPMTASTLFSAPANSLFVKMPVASSRLNRLWSVKTVRIPR